MFAEAMTRVPSRPHPISKDEFRVRQQRLYSQMRDGDICIIPSPHESVHSNDVHYRFRNSSDLMYLCGWQDPESTFVLYAKDGVWKSVLFVQPKDTLKEIWEGRRPGVEGALEEFAVDEAYSNQELFDFLDSIISDTKRIFQRRGIHADLDSYVDMSIRRRDRARQHFGSGPVSIEDPSNMIAELRLRKSPAEIEHMRYASIVSSLAHELAMRASVDGIHEHQLQSIIEGFFTYAGCSGWAYPSIVGCGENATILHYTVNSDRCHNGEIILIDAGAEYQGYASDITRSWPISGEFTPEQAAIYSIVLKAQHAAIAACQVGQPYNAPHEAARRVLAEGLIELGVIKQSLDEALDLDHGSLRDWYMHNTSHWIGLDVHDVGTYKPGGHPRLLEPGMCLTIEPGLYFGAWRPDVECPIEFSNIGIRIEDDILITKDGPVNLTRECPKEIHDLTAIIGQQP